MTFSEGQQQAVDPEASLRTELTGAIASAQIDITNAIAELARSGADISALTNQSQALQQLQRTVGSANLGSLLALRGDVANAATSATAMANQAVSTAANATAANANLTPAQRARATIEAVGRDLFEKHVLDPYLQFASPEDEEAYRKREQERQEAYKRALALHTDEGDRLALQIQKAQIADAKANGAERAPELARFEQDTDQALAALQPANEATKSFPSVAKPADEIRPADTSFDEALATLMAAGVAAPSDSPPVNGHGMTRATTSDGPQKRPSGRS